MVGRVGHRQSVLDIALQYLGSAEGCFVVAERMGVAITGTLQVGSIFEYAQEDIIDRHIATAYAKGNITPTTDIE